MGGARIFALFLFSNFTLYGYVDPRPPPPSPALSFPYSTTLPYPCPPCPLHTMDTMAGRGATPGCEGVS